MDFIEVNGVGLRYQLAGSGLATVVLIHEMGGSLESWDQVVPVLAAKRRVLAYGNHHARRDRAEEEPSAAHARQDAGQRQQHDQ